MNPRPAADGDPTPPATCITSGTLLNPDLLASHHARLLTFFSPILHYHPLHDCRLVLESSCHGHQCHLYCASRCMLPATMSLHATGGCFLRHCSTPQFKIARAIGIFQGMDIGDHRWLAERSMRVRVGRACELWGAWTVGSRHRFVARADQCRCARTRITSGCALG